MHNPLDGYLLTGVPEKPAAIAALLADRSEDERAQPFYRALDAVGAKAADEALLALRLVLAGMPADDDAIRRLRGLSALARAADDRAVRAAFAKDGPALADLAPLRPRPPAEIAAAAVAAYTQHFERGIR
jgi:hypothetical protein